LEAVVLVETMLEDHQALILHFQRLHQPVELEVVEQIVVKHLFRVDQVAAVVKVAQVHLAQPIKDLQVEIQPQ
jgi:hypothetical protein